MNMFARFDENPTMTLRVIKETKRYGRTDGRTHGRTDARTDGRTHGQRENSIPPTNKVCGGYNNCQDIVHTTGHNATVIWCSLPDWKITTFNCHDIDMAFQHMYRRPITRSVYDTYKIFSGHNVVSPNLWVSTVVPTKSDSNVFCLQLFSKM